MFIPVINNIHERGKILFAKRIKERERKTNSEKETRPDTRIILLRADGQGLTFIALCDNFSRGKYFIQNDCFG